MEVGCGRSCDLQLEGLTFGDSFVGEPAKLGILFDADEMAARVEAGNGGRAAADAVVKHDRPFIAECLDEVLEEFSKSVTDSKTNYTIQLKINKTLITKKFLFIFLF